MENLNPLMSFNNNNNWESNNNLQTLLLSSSSSTSTSNYNYLFPNNFQQTIIPNTSFLGQTHDNNNHDHEKREEEEEDHDDDDDDEELGAMKEMMYKMAAMQPVEVDPATVRRPRRRNVRISDDPQSVAARHRRERISERIRILQRLVPGGTKLDTASMLHEAIRYLKFLKRQIKLLQNPINNNNSVSSSSSSSSFSDYHHSAIHSTSNSNLSFVSSHYHHHNHHRLGLVGGSFNASLSTSSSSSLPQSTSGTGIFDDHHFWPVLNYNHYSTN